MIASLRLVSVLVLLLLTAASAHETERFPRRSPELREIADRIAGGASLLVDLAPRRDTRELHGRAHHVQEMLRGRRYAGDLARSWAGLRSAFESVRGSFPGSPTDPRIAFVLEHLGSDLDAGDPLVARFSPPGQERRTYAFVLTEVCVGTKRVGSRPCPMAQESLAFRLPRQVRAIRRVVGEWRDYGRGVKAQVIVDGQLVWQTDVNKSWDTDARDVNLVLHRGSTLTLQSSNGEPLWVRRLEIEYESH